MTCITPALNKCTTRWRRNILYMKTKSPSKMPGSGQKVVQKMWRNDSERTIQSTILTTNFHIIISRLSVLTQQVILQYTQSSTKQSGPIDMSIQPPSNSTPCISSWLTPFASWKKKKNLVTPHTEEPKWSLWVKLTKLLDLASLPPALSTRQILNLETSPALR